MGYKHRSFKAFRRRAYATFDNHKNFDNKPYVYVTEDYGKTWKKISDNLPTNEPCYVIKEGLKNPDLLFLGTEYSLWVSLDRGKTWIKYKSGDYPTVAVYDLHIHPRELDLIIGTHGRSIWTLLYRSIGGVDIGKTGKTMFISQSRVICI